MTNDAIRDLIERVEKAEGPDRELDCRIWCALSNADPLTFFETCRSVVSDFNQWQASRYTASIDAAMTLVAPRALWAHGSMEDGPFARLCWPQPDGTFSGGYVEADCATVPLSICAASLRARLSTAP